jgi:hypothetical protein
MDIRTYRSPLLKRTMAIISRGKCGYADYTEYQVYLCKGEWLCYKTNGYTMSYLASYPGTKGLKSVINLIWGR